MVSQAEAFAKQTADQVTFADPALNEAIRRGLTRVEESLRSAVLSDFGFATETARYLIDAGGKRFRPLFVLLAAQFGHPDRVEVIKAATSVELIHLATLYHDDVMDEALLRRGVASAHSRWGNTVAILAGDFLFARVSRLVAELGPQAGLIMSDAFSQLVTGQLRETVGVADKRDPIEHYLTVIAEKTGALIAAAGRLGAYAAEAPEKYAEVLADYGTAFGAAFQISDDIIDIMADASDSGKSPGTDLREGVLTLPMLYALAEKDATAERLAELLAKPLTDDKLVTEALALLRESAGMRRAEKMVADYVDRAKASLAALPAVPARAVLESLADSLIARGY